MAKYQKCNCECGCKVKTPYAQCTDCYHSKLDAIYGMFLDRPSVKRHIPFIKGKKILRAGPLEIID